MKIAFYGDSITAGLPGASYVAEIKQSLPQDEILNYGRINDTPLSLHRRIQSRHLTQPVDVAFILVGVNDLLVERSKVFSRLRRYWARSDEEFTRHYTQLLQTVCACAPRVICVSPLFIGENFDDVWQRHLERRAVMIQKLASAYPEAEYLDLLSTFHDMLRDKPVITELKQNLIQSVWDVVAHRSDAAMERISQARGLHYTIDGVHLNKAGAKVVAAGCLNALATPPHRLAAQ